MQTSVYRSVNLALAALLVLHAISANASSVIVARAKAECSAKEDYVQGLRGSGIALLQISAGRQNGSAAMARPSQSVGYTKILPVTAGRLARTTPVWLSLPNPSQLRSTATISENALADDGSSGSVLLCVIGSIITGLMYTLGVVTLALPKHYAALRGEDLSTLQSNILMIIYILINVLSVGPLMYASSQGAVAIVVPVVLASNLLSNMVIQGVAGSLVYSKTMRVGTLILALAAFQLIDVGPAESTSTGGTIQMITEPTALVWLGVMIGFMILGFAMLPCVCRLPETSLLKLFAFTAFISVAAALNNSLAKVVSEPGLSTFSVALTMALYVIMGAISTIGTAYGNAGLDNSISVPVFMCMQVLANGLTGIFVWGDWPLIDDQIAYVVVYLLIVLGIYLTAHVDLLHLYLLKTTGEAPEAELKALRHELESHNALARHSRLPRALTGLHSRLPGVLHEFVAEAVKEEKVRQ